ncbi:MAG: HDIG domain-containing protein [Bacteroidales bacterium]|nr:HDIG domain-containing protein [Bacteroidales bacterium]
MSGKRTFRVVLPLLAVTAVFLFVMPRTAKLTYEYKRGLPWKYETLIAPFDFPILKTEDQMTEERIQRNTAAVPYYRYSEETASESLRAVTEADFGEHKYMKGEIITDVRSLLTHGIMADDRSGGELDDALLSGDMVYVQRGKRVKTEPASEIYTLSEAKAKLQKDLAEIFTDEQVDSLLRAWGVYDALVPNMIFDRQATQLLQSESTAEISPTLGYVRAGQTIVSQDEVVTAETAQVLDSFEKEYESNLGIAGTGVLHWIGNAGIALLLVLLFFFALNFSAPEIISSSNRFLYILLIFTVFTVVSITVPRNAPNLIYMVPFVLCAQMLEVFFDRRLVVGVYSVSILPLLLYAEPAVPIFLIFECGGVVSVAFFRYFRRGWRQFIGALVTFAVMSVVYLCLRSVDLIGGNIPRVLVGLLISSVLCVSGYPLVYLFERIFNLVSHIRLSELCDTSGSLLRSLEQKAPGSFQHSLQVMNMADAVAGAVGADVLLVRAGALYHDIGKMQNPLCFVENESMLLTEDQQRYHSELSPLQSAQEIIRHVTEGAELAHRHHLPQVITDFILSHHGTSRMEYFYDKYLKEGGDPAGEDSFRYPGFRPRTREQVIIMLCDSIEAASRTLKDYSRESFSAFVDRIVEGKFEDGQISDADISVKDLEKVRRALKDYLAQMYHERIAYPKRIKK